MQSERQIRTYERADSVVFLKTKEAFGGLSNMAGGYPLQVNGFRILTSEALYQACRFPHLPQVQRLIIRQTSPMTAKMRSKPFRHDSRPDWDQVRVKIMRWSLRVKLAQNWVKFSELLLATDDRPIVEESRKDDFWGAKRIDEHTLVGTNVLGRLLMELREGVRTSDSDSLLSVEPLAIPRFLLYGRAIQAVHAGGDERRRRNPQKSEDQEPTIVAMNEATQIRVFDQPAVKESAALCSPRQHAPLPAIGHLKPYPAMKDSGVPWLGQVPEHWQVIPNRALFVEIKEREHPEDQMLSVTITKGVIRQRALLTDSSKKDGSNQDKSAYKLVQPGDIAYNKMRAWQGAIGTSADRGIVSPAYVVQRPRQGVHSRYFHYLLRTPAFAKEAERWSYGITSDMWSLRPEHFRMIYGCLPPFTEQVTIVRFLEHAERRIRRYVWAKQELIKLLEEQRQVIVHHAVTRGLDPNGRLKPSGVDWLGEVPEHWEVKPLKRAFVSMDYGISNPSFDEGTIRLLTMGNIKDGRVTVPQSGGVSAVDPLLLLAPGDLLFNRTNSSELVGKVGLFAGADSPVTFASYLVRMRAKPEHEPEYLNVVLNDVSVLAMSRREAIPSLHQSNLNPTRYGRLKVALPPLDEQREILQALKARTSDLAQAITAAHHEISLLREYRTRLTADVVTGKFDVRAAAANLPDEAGEPEADGESLTPAYEDATDSEVHAAPEKVE